MILIFDLDDTLYDEMTFVFSGFKAVSQMGYTRFGLCPDDSFSHFCRTLQTQGRGKVFDLWLAEHGIFSKKNQRYCINTYRHHMPDIYPFPAALDILCAHKDISKYIVTDGHKIVQQNKVNALNISKFFKRIFITHRFGIINAKPSLHCFKIIKYSEYCKWNDMIYIGDNPHKDFVSLKPLGVQTIRIKHGSYKNIILDEMFEADTTINDISELANAIEEKYDN